MYALLYKVHTNIIMQHLLKCNKVNTPKKTTKMSLSNVFSYTHKNLHLYPYKKQQQQLIITKGILSTVVYLKPLL